VTEAGLTMVRRSLVDFARGIVGSFHKVSAKYMPPYVAEFQFRYNNRENADIFGTAINGC
jgi:ISXO2 transposase-like protein